jgi:lipopolysaccharide transport system ATP-binding protein
MPHTVISVENLSKAYRLGASERTHDTLTAAVKSMALAPWRNLQKLRRLDTFSNSLGGSASADESDLLWALEDVCFDVSEGEVVGIIGRNGAGKSTLLKILSRITEPTSGRAKIRGRVSSLLEVGTGFHPELSGRDNIYMNGTILGMTKREVDRKFDQIVEFSGVERFLDTPVKRYSSGMQVRLAFSVAAHLEPEIMVIDEVLAVGDANFQKKCLGKMNDAATNGRTVLFVSHNMAAVEAFCSRAIMIDLGRKVHDGPCAEVIGHYFESGHNRNAIVDLRSHAGRPSRYAALVTELRILDETDSPNSSAMLGGTITFQINIECIADCHSLAVRFHITNARGQLVTTCYSYQQYVGQMDATQPLVVRCKLRDIRLAPGDYQVTVQAIDGNDILDVIEQAATFEVSPRDVYGTGRLPRSHAAIYIANTEWSVMATREASDVAECGI